MDARKTTGKAGEAANAMSCLAEIFNDYVGFTPQNLMVAYHTIPDRNGNMVTVKKNPYKESSLEWINHVNHCYDLEPTNLSRKGTRLLSADIVCVSHCLLRLVNLSDLHDSTVYPTRITVDCCCFVINWLV